MKDKTFNYILCVILFLGAVVLFATPHYVSAIRTVPNPYSDKVLDYTIYNCYNLSIKPEILDGDYTAFKFKDCTLNNKTWVCNCKNKENFTITLQSEPSKVNYINTSWLRLKINYSTYEFKNYDNVIMVEDFGTFAESTYEKEHRIGLICGDPIIKYVNQTVYIDKPVEIIREVEKPIYFDNCSNSYGSSYGVKLEQCSAAFKHNERVHKNLLILYSVIFAILGFIVGFKICERRYS